MKNNQYSRISGESQGILLT